MRQRALVGLLAALGASVAAERTAHANGAFPLANQLLANPSDATELVMRGNFGLVVSRDGGESWGWLCEKGMGYENIEPPMAVLESGVVLLALSTGISRSDASWCDFGLASGISASVVDLSIERATPEAAVALSLDLETMVSQVWESTDDGQSWSALGDAFPDFEATTLDVAATDSDRIYVSGRSVPGGKGTLLRSDDHGASWTSFEIPSLIASLPYIAALHPDDPDTVYVRRNGSPGTLWVTRDGGESFTMALRLNGPMKAFALSPDGNTALAGNLSDGLHRADTESLSFERIACAGVQCLSWNEDGLFSCGDLLVNGYLIGKSTDTGETFDSVLLPSCLTGPLECGDTTSTAMCAADWPTVRMNLSPTECADDPGAIPVSTACFQTGGAGGAGGMTTGPDSAGSAGDDAGAGGDAGAGVTTTAGAAGELSSSGGMPPASEEPLLPGGGCSCALGSRREDSWICILLAAGALRRRARRRAALSSGRR